MFFNNITSTITPIPINTTSIFTIDDIALMYPQVNTIQQQPIIKFEFKFELRDIFEQISNDPNNNSFRTCRHLEVPHEINTIQPGQYCMLNVLDGGMYIQWYYYNTLNGQHMFIFENNSDDIKIYTGYKIPTIPISTPIIATNNISSEYKCLNIDNLNNVQQQYYDDSDYENDSDLNYDLNYDLNCNIYNYDEQSDYYSDDNNDLNEFDESKIRNKTN